MDDLNQNPKLGSADRPNSYIGRSVPRERAKKLLEGKGKYVDDILLPRMVHLSYVRSPFAHAKIKSINTKNAKNTKNARSANFGNKFLIFSLSLNLFYK